jgi:hypothetical protein
VRAFLAFTVLFPDPSVPLLLSAFSRIWKRVSISGRSSPPPPPRFSISSAGSPPFSPFFQSARRIAGLRAIFCERPAAP